MIDAPILLFGLVGQWLLGWALASCLLVGFRRNEANANEVSVVERAGLGFVLGIGATAWILFSWSACGGQLNRQTSLILATIGWACGLPSLIACGLHQRSLSRSVIAGSTAVQEEAFCQLCQWVLGCLFVSAIVQTLLTPQRFWDERAIFAIKSAVLFEDHTIQSRDLAEPLFVQGHPRYPLLIPLAEQHLDALVGRVDDRLSKLVFPMLYIGLVLTVAGVLSRRMNRASAWLTALLMATIPALMPDDYGFLCGQADAPVGCFHGIAMLYLWDALEQSLVQPLPQRQWLGPIAIAGVCGGLTAFTKDEGIAFLMVDCGVLGLMVIGSAARNAVLQRKVIDKPSHSSPGWLATRRLLVIAAAFACVAAILLTPWFLHRRGLPLKGEMNYFGRMTLTLLIERLNTLAWTIPHLVQRMFGEWSEWGLQWWLMLATFVAAPWRTCRKPSQALLLLDVLGTVAALVVAGMLAPVRLEEHIGGSSHRFLMQIAPVAVIFVAGQLAPRRHHAID